MPQTVYGSGCVPLKPKCRAEIVELAERFNGWLEWDQFEFKDDCLIYAYNDIVGIGTAGDLDDFLLEIAEMHAAAGWAHYGEEWDDVCYFGPTEQSKLEAEIADLKRRAHATQESLASASAKLTALAGQ